MSFYADMNPELVALGNRVAGAFYNPGNENAAAARLAQNRAGLTTEPPNVTRAPGLSVGDTSAQPNRQPTTNQAATNARLPQDGMPPGMSLGGNQTRETHNTIMGAGGRDLTDRYNQLAGVNVANYGAQGYAQPGLSVPQGYAQPGLPQGVHGSIGAAGFQSQINNIRALRADVEAAFNQRQPGAGAAGLLRSHEDASKAYNSQVSSLSGAFGSARSPEERAAIAMQMKALGLSFSEGNKLTNTAMQGQTQLDHVGMQGQHQQANTAMQGRNQLANTALQGQNQLAAYGLQGANQLAAYGLQGANQMALEQFKQASPQTLALTQNYVAQADNYKRLAQQQQQDPWSTPDGARATADFITATQGMTPQQVAQAQTAARGPQQYSPQHMQIFQKFNQGELTREQAKAALSELGGN